MTLAFRLDKKKSPSFVYKNREIMNRNRNLCDF